MLVNCDLTVKLSKGEQQVGLPLSNFLKSSLTRNTTACENRTLRFHHPFCSYECQTWNGTPAEERKLTLTQRAMAQRTVDANKLQHISLTVSFRRERRH